MVIPLLGAGHSAPGGVEYPTYSTMTVIGHSYAEQSTNGGASAAANTFVSLLADIVGDPTVTNYAKQASILTWVPTYTPSGATDAAQNSATWLMRKAAFQGATAAPYTSLSGLHVICIGMNDLASSLAPIPNTGGVIASMKDDLKAMISRIRCAGKWEDNDAIVSVGANWTTPANGSDSSGTTIGVTSNAAAGNVTAAIPSDNPGGTLVAGLYGEDRTAAAGQGGVFNVDAGGTPSSVDARGGSNTGSGANRWRNTVHRIEGVTSGAKTITCDLTSLTGTAYIDWFGLEKSDAPPVLVMKQALLPAEGYTSYGGGVSDTSIGNWNTAIDEVCAEFTDGKVLAVDVSGIDGNSSYFDMDVGADRGIHLNDTGHDYYADQAAAATLLLP